MSEPLVLLPGFMCDSRLYEDQMADLGRDFVLVSAPVWAGERIEEIASNLLTQLPAKFALAGHSFGGMVAMEILRRAPERVTRIALMNVTPLPETPDFAAMREPRIVGARSGRLAEIMSEEIPVSALAPGPGRGAVRARMLEMAENLGPEAFYCQTRAIQRRRDQQSTLRKLTQPMLIICGAYDTIYPVKRHEFLSQLIPYSKLRVIETAGHLPTLEAPRDVTLALREWMSQPLVLR